VIRIVGSVGTDHHPFNRLLEWMTIVSEQLAFEIVVQTGSTFAAGALRRDHVGTFDYVPAAELAALMADADAVVCHGGPGTISLARSVGHRPIVIPRDPQLGEHVDDHQKRFAAKLAAEGTIDVASSVDELRALLADPRAKVHDETPLGERDRAVEEFALLVDQLLLGQIEQRRWRNRFLLGRLGGRSA